MKRFTPFLIIINILALNIWQTPQLADSAQSQQGVRPYIVVLKDGSSPDAVGSFAHQLGANVRRSYRSALKGFSADLTDVAFSALSERDDVAYIESDSTVSVFAQTVPPGIVRIGAPEHPFFGSATDIDIAIIDTGIEASHADLNYFTGTDFTGEGLFDGHGHGTHVAGIAAAKNNEVGVVGVAPGARLWAVKVLDRNGSGSFSNVIAGLDYVAQHASEIEVANMSLGGPGYSQAMRDAIQSCVNRGVVVVVAAGNSSTDVFGGDEFFGTSDDTVPAAFPECMTVTAMADTDSRTGALGSGTPYGGDDQFSSFTNYSLNAASGNPVASWGAAIDVAAPGANVLSTYKGGTYATMSGTSMAAPHVAGSVALYVAQHGRAHDAVGVYAIRQALIDTAQPQYIWQDGDTSDPDYNREFMVFNSVPWWSPAGPPPPPPPMTPPDAPQNTTCQRYNQTAIGVGWQDASYNESFFEVQRATRSSSSAWTAYSTIGTASRNSLGFVDTNAKRNGEYRYRVRAVNNAGTSEWSNVAEFVKR